MDYGTETGDARAVGWPCAVGGDSGMETGDDRVGKWTSMGSKVGTRVAVEAG